MTLYKAVIRPLASFSSYPQGDTFFGAFCWAFKYRYGEEELEKMLEKSQKETPQIIFSNAFPTGCLPLPMGIYDEDRKRYGSLQKQDARTAYQKNKTYKKCTMLEREAFCKIQTGDWRGYSAFLRDEGLCLTTSVHNLVGRNDGTVGGASKENNETASLFVTEEMYMKGSGAYDVYILTELDFDTVKETVSLMLELGIGGRKSAGKGAFELISITEETELCSVENANGYIALSNFVPEAKDPSEGWYKTVVKFGRMDREYAAGNYPFKKPILFIQAGAMFETESTKPYYGKIVTDVAEKKVLW